MKSVTAPRGCGRSGCRARRRAAGRRQPHAAAGRRGGRRRRRARRARASATTSTIGRRRREQPNATPVLRMWTSVSDREHVARSPGSMLSRTSAFVTWSSDEHDDDRDERRRALGGAAARSRRRIDQRRRRCRRRCCSTRIATIGLRSSGPNIGSERGGRSAGTGSATSRRNSSTAFDQREYGTGRRTRRSRLTHDRRRRCMIDVDGEQRARRSRRSRRGRSRRRTAHRRLHHRRVERVAERRAHAAALERGEAARGRRRPAT